MMTRQPFNLTLPLTKNTFIKKKITYLRGKKVFNDSPTVLRIHLYEVFSLLRALYYVGILL